MSAATANSRGTRLAEEGTHVRTRPREMAAVPTGWPLESGSIRALLQAVKRAVVSCGMELRMRGLEH